MNMDLIKDIPTTLIVKYAGSPFKYRIWPDVSEPIRLEEIEDCLKYNQQKLRSNKKLGKKITQKARDNHIQNIAFLVKNPTGDPVALEVTPYDQVFIFDGWHRFAAAIYRKDKVVSCSIGGSITAAIDLGLIKEEEDI